MKSLSIVLLAALVATASPVAQALEVGESEFAWMSELARDGFKPIAVSNAANASFGMMRGTELYVCFLADTKEHQERWQAAILANIKDDDAGRTVPDVPFVCILA